MNVTIKTWASTGQCIPMETRDNYHNCDSRENTVYNDTFNDLIQSGKRRIPSDIVDCQRRLNTAWYEFIVFLHVTVQPVQLWHLFFSQQFHESVPYRWVVPTLTSRATCVMRSFSSACAGLSTALRQPCVVPYVGSTLRKWFC